MKDLYGEALRQLGYDLETLKEEVGLLLGWDAQISVAPNTGAFPCSFSPYILTLDPATFWVVVS